MKLSDLISSNDHLKWIQGVEANLLRRRQIGNQGGIIVMILGGLLQIWIFIFGEMSAEKVLSNLSAFVEFTHKKVTGASTDMFIPAYDLIAAMSGIFLILAGFGFILLIRHTRILVKESGEPFRYTFWIDKFEPVAGIGPGNGSGNSEKTDQPDDAGKSEPEFAYPYHFHLLHHDLKERLNLRIKRLSLLNLDSMKSEKTGTAEQDTLSESALRLTAHIHVDGHYAIREKKKNERIVHVMPRVRIGASGRPTTLAFPVKFSLEENERTLDANRYNQLVERVYSSIATEIYKQIESDVKKKMDLFPTKYLRAVAYFNEAEDFAKSNTIDAYDHAIDLYRQSRRYFEIAEFKKLTEWMIKLPVVWRLRVNREHDKAKVHIGYAKCLIYRRIISILSGCLTNPIFEIIPDLKEVIRNLELIHKKMSPPGNEEVSFYFSAFLRYPKDSRPRHLSRKPLESLFERQRCILFDAHVVIALAYYNLEAVKKPREHLDKAKEVDPPQSERNALYYLGKGIIEPDVEKKLPHLRQAAERAPEFQFGQYMLAYWFEMHFRRSNEIIKPARVKRVIKKYDRVLEINPGNVAALAAKGYLYWLLGNQESLEQAKKSFREGYELKAISSETFLGELYYGLARIAAEEGRFNDSYDLYHQAIQVDPGVAAWSVRASNRGTTTPYFEFIGPQMLNRYEDFRKTVAAHCEHKLKEIESLSDSSNHKNQGKLADTQSNGEKPEEEVTEKVIKAVYSFVLNDYGNASFNYYFRFGDRDYLTRSTISYEKAISGYPENIVAKYNIYQPYRWKADKESEEKSKKYLEDIVNKFPIWQAAVISLAKHSAEKYNKELDVYYSKLSEVEVNGPNRSPDTGRSGPSGMDSAWNDLVSMESHLNELKIKMNTAKHNLLKNTMWSPLTDDGIKNQNGIESGTQKQPETFREDESLFDMLGQTKVQWDRLGDYDAYALSVWSEILYYQDKPNLKGLNNLCKHLFNVYYPENFDVGIICEKVLKMLSRQDGDDQWHEELRFCRDIIRANINYWLDHDPVQFHSLDWARIYYEGEETDELIRMYCKAIKLNRIHGLETVNHVHYNILGILYDSQQKHMHSISNYKKAIYYHGELPIYHCNLGRAYGNLKDPDWNRMIRHCSKAVELRKKQPEDAFGLDYYYDFLADAYSGAEKLDDFEQILHKEDKLRSIENARLYNRVGNLYYNRLDYEKAIRSYEKAIGRADQIPIYHCNLGRAYGNLEIPNLEQMIQHCGKAVELRKKQQKDAFGLDYYYEFLAEGYYRAGEMDEFEKKFQLDFDLTDSERARVYNQIGNLFYNSLNFVQAIHYYEKAIGQADQIPIYHCNLGRAYGKLEIPIWDRMIRHCRKALELRKKQPEDAFGMDYYYEFLADAYSGAEKLDDFEQILHKEDKLNAKEYARLYNRIGNLYFNRLDYRQAIRNYEKAISRADQIPIYHCNLGRAYGNLKIPNLDQMIQHCGKAVELRKKQPEDEYGLDYYYEFLKEAYSRSGKLEEFEKKLQAEEKLTESEREGIINRYSTNYELNDPDQSVHGLTGG
jgi:tetratricopeptide (TPR) repeat protein